MINWNLTLDSTPLTQENCLTKQVEYLGHEPEYVLAWFSAKRERWYAVDSNLTASNFDGGAVIELDGWYKPTHWIYLADLDK